MKILIGTPTNDNNVTVQYLRSVRALEKRFEASTPRIGCELMFVAGSFLPASRNALASIVLNNSSFSHLLFIDADMGFEPEAVMKLINANRPFIGCFCPARRRDDNRMYAASRQANSAEKARNLASEYPATDFLQKERVRQSNGYVNRHMVKDGIISTLQMGMALTLIQRSVIETISIKMPDILIKSGRPTSYSKMGLNGDVLQCFSSVAVDGVYLSEDISFCRRWTHGCGGEIFGVTDQTIEHVGASVFAGKLQDRIDFEDGRAAAIQFHAEKPEGGM